MAFCNAVQQIIHFCLAYEPRKSIFQITMLLRADFPQHGEHFRFQLDEREESFLKWPPPHKLGQSRRERWLGSGTVWGGHQGEGARRDATDRRVRAEVIVFVAPVADAETNFGQKRNQCWLRQSSREVPLKLSMKAFCMGLPGWMW